MVVCGPRRGINASCKNLIASGDDGGKIKTFLAVMIEEIIEFTESLSGDALRTALFIEPTPYWTQNAVGLDGCTLLLSTEVESSGLSARAVF